jgi:hypothetical protein
MRSTPVIHAGQAADLANMFYRSYQEDPKALTKEAIEQVRRGSELGRCSPASLGVTE